MDKELKVILNGLKMQINNIKKYNDSMEEASWGYEQGVLLSGNDAQKIIDFIKHTWRISD